MEQMPFNVTELINIPELQGMFRLIDSEETDLMFKWLEHKFHIPCGQIDWSLVNGSNTIKIDNCSESQICDYLLSINVSTNTDACWSIIWSDSKIGVNLKFTLISKFIGEIWYPAKADVWIISPRKDFCIEITHESVLSYGFVH